MKQENVNKTVLIFLVLGISLLFLGMIRTFLVTLLLAGIFSALLRPVYLRFLKWFGGRPHLASLTTIVVVIFVFLLPFIAFLGVVTAQGIKVSSSIGPWLSKKLSEPEPFSQFFNSLPFAAKLAPYQGFILEKAGHLLGSTTNFLIAGLSTATWGTVDVIFRFMIFLYTIFFFLVDGEKLLIKILYYLPLEHKDEMRLLQLFTSVTWATLKGTAIVGALQGAICGSAFGIFGVESPVFWGTLMAFLSVVPGIGTGLVWIPASAILILDGRVSQGVGLALICALVAGSIDNFLRPQLVGKDTKMHELLIVFGILGGIYFFGFVGFILGPVVAALFVAVWEIYGEVFSAYLPEVKPLGQLNPKSKKG